MSDAAKNRARAINELIATERTYVADLKTIERHWKPFLASPAFGDCTPRETSDIFSNTETLLQLHVELLAALERDVLESTTLLKDKQTSEQIGVVKVGRTVADFADSLKLYSVFVGSDQTRADALKALKTHKKASNALNLARSRLAVGRFGLPATTSPAAKDMGLSKAKAKAKAKTSSTIVESSSGSVARGALDISDYLIKPLQRLCKYPLLLREILRHTPPDSEEAGHLRAAAEAVESAVQQVNQSRKRADVAEHFLEIQKRMSGGKEPPPDLMTRTELVREGQLALCRKNTLKAVAKGKVDDVVMYLFDDLLVITKKIGGKVKGGKPGSEIVIHEIELRFVLGNDNVCSTAGPQSIQGRASFGSAAFEVAVLAGRENSRTLLLFASSEEEKRNWVEDIERTRMRLNERLQLQELQRPYDDTMNPFIQTAGFTPADNTVDSSAPPPGLSLTSVGQSTAHSTSRTRTDGSYEFAQVTDTKQSQRSVASAIVSDVSVAQSELATTAQQAQLKQQSSFATKHAVPQRGRKMISEPTGDGTDREDVAAIQLSGFAAGAGKVAAATNEPADLPLSESFENDDHDFTTGCKSNDASLMPRPLRQPKQIEHDPMSTHFRTDVPLSMETSFLSQSPPAGTRHMTREERIRYVQLFAKADADCDGVVSSVEGEDFFSAAAGKLLPAQLSKAWALADKFAPAGSLNLIEFAVAVHIVYAVIRGGGSAMPGTQSDAWDDDWWRTGPAVSELPVQPARPSKQVAAASVSTGLLNEAPVPQPGGPASLGSESPALPARPPKQIAAVSVGNGSLNDAPPQRPPKRPLKHRS